MHVRGMALPGPDQPQPAAVAMHHTAQLPLDRRVDQDPVHVRQRRRQMQQRRPRRRPALRADAALVRPHQAGELDRLPLCRASAAAAAAYPARYRRPAPTGGCDAAAAARRAGARCPPPAASAGHAPSPRGRAARFRAMVWGAPQKRLRSGWIVWKPGPDTGSRAPPAKQPPVKALPMMCSGPGTGPTGPDSAADALATGSSINAKSRTKRTELGCHGARSPQVRAQSATPDSIRQPWTATVRKHMPGAVRPPSPATLRRHTPGRAHAVTQTPATPFGCRTSMP